MTIDLALDKPDPILLSLFANRFMSVAEAAGRSLQLTSIVRPPFPLASPREVRARSLLSPSLVAVDQHQGAPRLLLRPLCAQRRSHCQRCVPPLDDRLRAGAATDASPFARAAPHLPVHLGSMSFAVRYQVDTLGIGADAPSGDGIVDGDVLLTNSPKAGGSRASSSSAPSGSAAFRSPPPSSPSVCAREHPH